MAGKLRDIRFEIQEEHWEFTRSRQMPDDQRQLLNAVRKRNFKKVEKILSRGGNAQMRDEAGNTLLHIIAQSTQNEDTVATMRTLLHFGADPNDCDRFGRTAVHLATANGSKLVLILLHAGGLTNSQDNAGRTPLMEACSSDISDALVTVSILMDRHSNVVLKDEDGTTALHCVCKNRKQDLHVRNEIALKLLLAGQSANVTDNAGKIPLCYELEKFVNCPRGMVFDKWRFDLVRTLVHAGSRFNPRNKQHERWLQYVANFSSVDLLENLLEIAGPSLPLSVLKRLPKLTAAADDGHDLFHQRLRTISRAVRTLQELTRIAIREILKGKVLIYANLLPIPQKVQGYVAFKD